jgi:hypothetical protein
MYSSWVRPDGNSLTLAYIQVDGFAKLREVNVALLKTAIEAIDSLAPNLQHVILQTGGKVLYKRHD